MKLSQLLSIFWSSWFFGEKQIHVLLIPRLELTDICPTMSKTFSEAECTKKDALRHGRPLHSGQSITLVSQQKIKIHITFITRHKRHLHIFSVFCKINELLYRSVHGIIVFLTFVHALFSSRTDSATAFCQRSHKPKPLKVL